MRVLVTGATGFVGSHVVRAFARGGHEVRALVRPAADPSRYGWTSAVQVHTADLRAPGGLDEALEDVDAVVHLAAQVTGGDEARFAGTVTTTERLIDAVVRAGVSRLILGGSYAVYDWSAASRSIVVDSPLEGALYERDGYAVAKWWQERIARDAAERGQIELTVLRPGYVWGPDALVPGVGLKAGAVQFVFGPHAEPPLTYVENCADAFVAVTEDARSVGRTYNVVDAQGVSAWRYARDYTRLSCGAVTLVPVPYSLAFGMVRVVHAVARVVLGPRMRLPSIFVPRRFEARFKALHHTNAELAGELGWRPPYSYADSLRDAFGGDR